MKEFEKWTEKAKLSYEDFPRMVAEAYGRFDGWKAALEYLSDCKEYNEYEGWIIPFWVIEEELGEE